MYVGSFVHHYNYVALWMQMHTHAHPHIKTWLVYHNLVSYDSLNVTDSQLRARAVIENSHTYMYEVHTHIQ